MARMVLEQPDPDLLEGRACRCDLVEDLDAVTLLFDHPLDSSHLAADPA
jgi:hypothetical protein